MMRLGCEPRGTGHASVVLRCSRLRVLLLLLLLLQMHLLLLLLVQHLLMHLVAHGLMVLLLVKGVVLLHWHGCGDEHAIGGIGVELAIVLLLLLWQHAVERLGLGRGVGHHNDGRIHVRGGHVNLRFLQEVDGGLGVRVGGSGLLLLLLLLLMMLLLLLLVLLLSLLLLLLVLLHTIGLCVVKVVGLLLRLLLLLML